MSEVAIVGAGLVGPLLALILVVRGFKVNIYESRKDPRKNESEGRSFDLALSKRGLDALEKAGLKHVVLNGNSVPVDSRLVYKRDGSSFVWLYGQRGECLHSIERKRLNYLVLDEAERKGVNIHFEHKVVDCDVRKGELTVKAGQELRRVVSDFIFGCDGAHSVVRMRGILRAPNSRFRYEQSYIPYGYKELHVPATPDGRYALKETHLHLWPREKFMLMGLPNPDQTVTLTLFMPLAKFEETSDLVTLFREEFPGIIDKLGGEQKLVEQYSSIKTGSMISIKCHPHHFGKALLLGDAAHAMVPFYGQGVNAGFEDCLILDGHLEEAKNDLLKAAELYAKDRPKDADAIVSLSLYNFEEMRDFVSKPSFWLKKQAMVYLSRCVSQWFTPLYSMVTFSRIPYHDVVHRHIKQQEVLNKTAVLITVFLLLVAMYFCLPATILTLILTLIVLLYIIITPMYHWDY